MGSASSPISSAGLSEEELALIEEEDLIAALALSTVDMDVPPVTMTAPQHPAPTSAPPPRIGFPVVAAEDYRYTRPDVPTTITRSRRRPSQKRWEEEGSWGVDDGASGSVLQERNASVSMRDTSAWVDQMEADRREQEELERALKASLEDQDVRRRNDGQRDADFGGRAPSGAHGVRSEEAKRVVNGAGAKAGAREGNPTLQDRRRGVGAGDADVKLPVDVQSKRRGDQNERRSSVDEVKVARDSSSLLKAAAMLQHQRELDSQKRGAAKEASVSKRSIGSEAGYGKNDRVPREKAYSEAKRPGDERGAGRDSASKIQAPNKPTRQSMFQS